MIHYSFVNIYRRPTARILPSRILARPITDIQGTEDFFSALLNLVLSARAGGCKSKVLSDFPLAVTMKYLRGYVPSTATWKERLISLI